MFNIICFSKAVKLYKHQAKKHLKESFYGVVMWLLSVNFDLLWKSVEEKKIIIQRAFITSCMQQLLKVCSRFIQKDHYFTVHHRNVQILDAELYKVRGYLLPWYVLAKFTIYKIDVNFLIDFINSSIYDLPSLQCFTPKVLQMVALELKNLKKLDDFENSTRK